MSNEPPNSAPQVVFAITSVGNDIFSAMTRVAIASLRITNPDIRVTVACDGDTDRAMNQANNPLVREVDEWLVIDTPPGESGFRNRFVKTSLRSIINGPFLFLDSDILVRGDISGIFEIDADIAAARNHSTENYSDQIKDGNSEDFVKLGWTLSGDIYINGGVIYFNDTAVSRQLANEWHRRWRKSFEMLGKHYDQPSLNAAIYKIKPSIKILPDNFNAQFPYMPCAAPNATIWHFYSSYDSTPPTYYGLLMSSLVRGAALDYQAIRTIMREKYPWCCRNIIDRTAVISMMRTNRIFHWENAWLSRNLINWIIMRPLSLSKIILKKIYRYLFIQGNS